jgi:hypothetical protein
VKCRRIQWVRDVSRLGEIRNPYRIFVRSLLENDRIRGKITGSYA